MSECGSICRYDGVPENSGLSSIVLASTRYPWFEIDSYYFSSENAPCPLGGHHVPTPSGIGVARRNCAFVNSVRRCVSVSSSLKIFIWIGISIPEATIHKNFQTTEYQKYTELILKGTVSTSNSYAELARGGRRVGMEHL